MSEPLQFPTDSAGWTAFVTERPIAAIATVAEKDAALKAGTADAAAALELWNDADIALSQATHEAYLLSESHPDGDVRGIAEEQVQTLEALSAQRLLDRELFAALDGLDTAGLDDEQVRLLEHTLRDFRRGGVDLPDAERERVRELTDRDTALSLEFSRNVRDGKRSVRVAPEGLAGLPQDFIDAHPAGDDGLVVLTTDYPDLMPVREYATDRATRTALVGAYNELAWPENDAVLAELLAVRAERAKLLGYGDWADFETEPRMIGSGAAIAEFLQRLDVASRDAADAEYPVLLARMRAAAAARQP